MPCESHTNQPVGSRDVRASRRTPGPSLAGHRSCTKSLSSRIVLAPVSRRTKLVGHPKAHLILEVDEARLAHPVVAILGHVTALDGFVVIIG